ncbi:MAG: polyhydroxyalkanoic acid synthase [Burkholderiales bacterium]|nr:polyhydroxyalkanoic acid synthase [Burkholderiales bacterium]
MDHREAISAPSLDLDRSTHAALNQFTKGISPASLTLSYLDWWLHLVSAPGKQLELADKARRKLTCMARTASRPPVPSQPCITPLPQDQRFNDPAWQQWPYNLFYQNFLLTQQWWHNATTEVHGVTQHHEDVVTFNTRQWLDMFSPSNFFWTNPEALLATQHESGANLMRGAVNWLGDVQRAISGEPSPDTRKFLPGQQVALTPGKVVFRNHLIELIQYTPTTPKVHPEPVLIVPSWIMKYYILDLSPHNSMVRYLVEQGHTVFIVSWRNPDANDRDVGMDDYLKLGPLAALDVISQIVPGRKIHAAGYCLGGTLLSIAAATLAREGDDRLVSLTLLAAETDFEEPGELGLFIDASQVAYLEDLMWEQGYLDGKQMGNSFTFLNTRDLLWSRMVRDYLLGTRQPLNDLMSWNADVTRMPYRMHAEYLKSLYLNNELSHGAYRVDGRPAVLSDIEVPMFVIGTVKDHVSPWRSVYKIHLLADAEITFALTSGGHNAGIVSEPGHAGRSYQIQARLKDGKYVDPDTWLATAARHEGSWWLAWQAWLASHSGKPVAPPSMGLKEQPPLCDAPGEYVLVR